MGRLVAALLATAAALGAAGSAGSAPPRLVLGYTVPPRYGLDANHDGLVDYPTTAAQVNPPTWTALVSVRVAGKPCDRAARYAWRIGNVVQPPGAFRPAGPCVFEFGGFPERDKPYRVTATALRGGGSGQVAVTVHDTLLVGLGDSTGSGEGNPDIPATATAQARWEDRRCDRSARSFEAQAAGLLEGASDRSSVTFVHLACSGATILRGVAGPYRGLAPVADQTIPAQISEMKRLAGTRPVDAVVVSVGINDLAFGDVVRFCTGDGGGLRNILNWGKIDCWALPFRAGLTLREWVRSMVAQLPARYDELARTFGTSVPPGRIFLTQYPDATRDADGRTCDPLIIGDNGILTRREAAEAEAELLVPVNAAIAAAAAAHGWQVVTGAAERSRTHGYCVTDPAQRWFVTYPESQIAQGNENGTLHPDELGHADTARLVVARLRAAGAG